MMTKLSVFITTYNNGRTLVACLESIKWADEIVILDSYSSDETQAIAERYGARFHQHEFLGYGCQKQMALDMTSHEWVLLLDADEALSPVLQAEIRTLLEQGPKADGYEMPRLEQTLWRMADTRLRLNYFLRLFDKSKGHISTMPVHAAPQVQGRIGRLSGHLYHYGETDLHTKVEKINAYSTGLVADKVARGRRGNPWLMVFYPPFFFLRSYLFKRSFLNGWIGFIYSVTGAYYVFLKYAKVYEHYQFEKYGSTLMPPQAPRSPREYGRGGQKPV